LHRSKQTSKFQKAGGSPGECRAGLDRALARGWCGAFRLTAESQFRARAHIFGPMRRTFLMHRVKDAFS
jgi:hypothetical protein